MLACLSTASTGRAETLAYWRFEDQPAGAKLDAAADVTTPPFTTTRSELAPRDALRTFNTRPEIDPPNTSPTFVDVSRVVPQLAGGVANARAVRFAGSQDLYTAPRRGKLAEAALTTFTVEGLFQLDVLSRQWQNRYQVILGKDGKPTRDRAEQPFAVVVGGEDNPPIARDCLTVNILDRTGTFRAAASQVPLEAGRWYAFAAVCDGATMQLHLNRFDGRGYQLEGSVDVVGGMIESSDRWTIGRGMHARQPNSWLQGSADEIRISDAALPPEQWLMHGIDTLPQTPAVPSPATQPTGEATFAVADVADPAVLLHEGVYYLYGTTGDNGFKVFASRDLQTWTDGGTILAAGDEMWGDRAFWAPDIVARNGKFYFLYSTVGPLPGTGGKRSSRVGVAVADAPTGPFREVQPRMPLIGRAVIDPQVFVDDDGRPWLYFVSDINENNGRGAIYVAPMTDDLLGIAEEPVECIAPSRAWEGGVWNEGPFVFKEGDEYVMLYSGEFWNSPEYAVGFATSRSPRGPWTKSDAPPILYKYGGLVGTGHNSLVRAPDGGWLTFFHAHDVGIGGRGRDTYFARFVVDRDARGALAPRVEPWRSGTTRPATRTADATSPRKAAAE